MSKIKSNTTDIRLQQHPAECGSVCLGILLTWLGHYYSSSYLRTICGVGRDGATIAQLQRGAYKLGFTTKISKKGINSLKKIESPLIIHWNLNHFVVFESIGDDSVEINDPAVGHRNIPTEEFITHYTGICIEITKEKVQESQVPLIRQKRISLLEYLAPLTIKKSLQYALIPGLFLLFLEVVYSGLFNAYYNYSVANNLGHWAGIIALTIIIIISFRWLLTGWSSKMQNYQSHAIKYNLEKKILSILSQRDISFFERHYNNEITQHIFSIKSITSMITSTFFMLLESFPFIIISLLLVLLINPPLFLIIFVPYLFSIIYRHSMKESVKEERIKGNQAESIYQNKLIQRLFDYERFSAMGLKFELFSSLVSASSRKHSSSFNVSKKGLIYSTMIEVIDSLTHPLMLFVSTYLLVIGELNFGEYSFTYMLCLILLPKIKQLQEKVDQYIDAKDSVAESEEFFSEHLPYSENNNADINCSLIDPSALFQLIHVGFGYNGIDCTLFDDVNLTIKQGQIICFTGDSGSGKTSLLDIISGQRVPLVGESLHNGINAYRSVNAGFVFSDEAIEGTLASFLFGDKPIDQIKMSAIIKLVELTSRLGFSADNGGHEPINAEKLSVGECQRLSLARALCFNSKLIFFDEAFSHIGLSQARRIINRLKLTNTTLIMATQRGEINALADNIYDV